MNTLLHLLAALAQDPAPVAPPTPPEAVSTPIPDARVADDPARPWQTVDRIVMIVNQDIITESELRRGYAQFARKFKITSETEQHEAEVRIIRERVYKRLRVQAGAILGVDEKLIDARVHDSLEQMQKRENGPVGLAKFLESKDITGPEVKQLLRDDIYDQIYTEGLTGEAPGPLGRVTTDRYVRPGTLSLLFQQTVEIPAEMEAIGGHVGTVKFQQIILDVEQVGGIEEARELARTLLERLRAGEDMGELARQNGAPGGDAVTEVSEPRLRDLFPEIAAFTSTASADELSAPISGLAGNKPMLRIVRFLERSPAVVPEFVDAEVQTKLRERAEQRLEDYRLQDGYADLLRASYVWPPEFAGRPQP